MRYRFTAPLWQYEGDAAWHFVTLPHDISDAIEDGRSGARSSGFGSVPVHVAVGKTSWKTSVFPSKQEASFVLPIKKAVRERERLSVGDQVSVQLTA